MAERQFLLSMALPRIVLNIREESSYIQKEKLTE